MKPPMRAHGHGENRGSAKASARRFLSPHTPSPPAGSAWGITTEPSSSLPLASGGANDSGNPSAGMTTLLQEPLPAASSRAQLVWALGNRSPGAPKPPMLRGSAGSAAVETVVCLRRSLSGGLVLPTPGGVVGARSPEGARSRAPGSGKGAPSFGTRRPADMSHPSSSNDDGLAVGGGAFHFRVKDHCCDFRPSVCRQSQLDLLDWISFL